MWYRTAIKPTPWLATVGHVDVTLDGKGDTDRDDVDEDDDTDDTDGTSQHQHQHQQPLPLTSIIPPSEQRTPQHAHNDSAKALLKSKRSNALIRGKQKAKDQAKVRLAGVGRQRKRHGNTTSRWNHQQKIKQQQIAQLQKTQEYVAAVKTGTLVNGHKFQPNNDNKGQAYLSKDDYIYKNGIVWDGPPIVVEEYKLIFFTVPKVGCTVMKQLFRRIAGYSLWKKVGGSGLPHNPATNGLTYLYHYNITDATNMMTSEDWTRAIFVRDPKERLLSAYLDKAKRKQGQYISRHCCPDCGAVAGKTLKGFLQVMEHCMDPHWMPQSRRMEHRFWETVQFVGHIETAAADARALLERVGAWEKYGATGWGDSGNETIFESLSNVKHRTKADAHLTEYFDKETELLANEYYNDDYAYEKFGFQLRTLVLGE
jgi:hypothetical protein